MSKRPKSPKSARKEGADAAQEGHARAANPYPSSDTDKRNEWFNGYDAGLLKPKGKSGKSKAAKAASL